MDSSAQTKTVSVWEQYVDDVLSGDIVTGELVKAACQRHKNDTQNSDLPYVFDQKKAKHVIDFFRKYLILTTGMAKPTPFVPEPWQQFILVSLFGRVHKGGGLRRYRSAHIMVARKNGKSHLLAGIGLYALVADDEMGAQIYSVATKKDQAKMIWDAALEFRRQSDTRAGIVKKSVSALYVVASNSKFAALSSDEEGLDGLNVHIG